MVLTSPGDVSGNPFLQKTEVEGENVPGTGRGKFRAS